MTEHIFFLSHKFAAIKDAEPQHTPHVRAYSTEEHSGRVIVYTVRKSISINEITEPEKKPVITAITFVKTCGRDNLNSRLPTLSVSIIRSGELLVKVISATVLCGHYIKLLSGTLPVLLRYIP